MAKHLAPAPAKRPVENDPRAGKQRRHLRSEHGDVIGVRRE